MTITDAALGGGGVAIATSFAMAVRGHFASTTMPRGMRLVTALSLLAGLTLIGLQLVTPPAALSAAVGCALQWLGFALFAWAVRASRGHGRRLAFDVLPADVPVLVRGPYRHIRHPFYVAYAVFWLGWAIGVGQALGFLPVLGLVALYVAAAKREEASLLAGPHGDGYRRYRAVVGVLPGLGGRRHAA